MFSEYPANNKTVNNEGALFWHIAVKKAKIRGKPREILADNKFCTQLTSQG
jgi:hypothetical protein